MATPERFVDTNRTSKETRQRLCYMIHHKFYSLRKSHFRGLLSGPGKEKVWKRTVCIRKKHLERLVLQ